MRAKALLLLLACHLGAVVAAKGPYRFGSNERIDEEDIAAAIVSTRMTEDKPPLAILTRESQTLPDIW